MIRQAGSSDPSDASDKRQFPRRSLPVGYSAVRVRPQGKQRFHLAGHAYDISAGGVRFELDHALADGEEIDIRVTLPGPDPHEVQAHGSVIRFHDPDESGPVRMAIAFSDMANPTDRLLIDSYVRHGELTPAHA